MASTSWLGETLADEARIVAGLRSGHSGGTDWGTWANIMRVRHGDPPVRPPPQKPRTDRGARSAQAALRPRQGTPHKRRSGSADRYGSER